MHTSTFVNVLLVSGSGLVSGAWLRTRDNEVAAALRARQAPMSAAEQAQSVSCSQASILAQGIAVNIQDQQQELATANQMATILQANPVDTAAWGQARTALLQFVNNGIAIRESNQLITPADNKATPGVAKVANAQLEELGLAQSLTPQGSDNVQANLQTVMTLQKDFSGGIQQNMKNMADAMAGCGSTGAAAPAPAPAPAGGAGAGAGAGAGGGASGGNSTGGTGTGTSGGAGTGTGTGTTSAPSSAPSSANGGAGKGKGNTARKARRDRGLVPRFFEA